MWGALILLHVCADIFWVYRPGEPEEVLAGRLGPCDLTQTSLFCAAIPMAPPALMVEVTLRLPTALCRWINVGRGAFYTLVKVSTLIGEACADYLFYGAIDSVVTVFIASLAFRWLRPGADLAS